MHKDNLCLVCLKKNLNFKFWLKNSVSSDGKFFLKPISHLYCNNCQYIYVNPKKRFDHKKFYRVNYDFLTDVDAEPTTNGKKYSERLVDFYKPYIINSSKKKFIDIGAGKGNFLKAIYHRFPKLNYYAFEPTKAYKILSSKKFIKNKYNDFFNSKYFKYKFDFLSLVGVLEHVSNPKNFLLEIKKIMNEDSYLLIEVPNFLNNKADLITIDHFSKFTDKSLQNIFNIVGLKIINKQVLQRVVPMQYIVKISNKRKISNNLSTEIILKKAEKYIKRAFSDVKKIKTDLIAIYGQGLILNYLIGANILDLKKISCIIDDNPLYWGTLWKNKVPIVNFKTFETNYKTLKIFLAMNDCYHSKLTKKLKKYDLIGI